MKHAERVSTDNDGNLIKRLFSIAASAKVTVQKMDS